MIKPLVENAVVDRVQSLPEWICIVWSGVVFGFKGYFKGPTHPMFLNKSKASNGNEMMNASTS